MKTLDFALTYALADANKVGRGQARMNAEGFEYE
jgi:hypothetical protein